MSWFLHNTTTPITFDESAAYFAAKGATGEQPDDPTCDYCNDEGCADCLDEYDRDRLDDR